MHVDVCTYMDGCTCSYVHRHIIYIYIYMYMYMHMSCMYLYIYMCVCVCLCVLYIHVHRHTVAGAKFQALNQLYVARGAHSESGASETHFAVGVEVIDVPFGI